MNISRMFKVSLFALMLLAIPASSFAGVFIQVGFAPPALPVYEQPACPGDGYIWTPGYWAYGPVGYYWVPGTWVMAPEPGFLWTPGYWGWGGGFYAWHPGYWGPHIGFYGGVNYGYGYFGHGYEGGYWSGRTFYYNRSVNNVTVTNVHIYNKTVNNVTVNRVSFNGGNGGINARPGRDEEIAARDRHIDATGVQRKHQDMARENRDLWASNNHGRPAIAATERPADFHGRVVPAKEGGPEYRQPENRGANRPASGREHAKGLVAAELDDLAAVSANRIVGYRGETPRKRRGCLVAVLVAIARVPAQIGDQERADANRFARAGVGGRA